MGSERCHWIRGRTRSRRMRRRPVRVRIAGEDWWRFAIRMPLGMLDDIARTGGRRCAGAEKTSGLRCRSRLEEMMSTVDA